MNVVLDKRVTIEQKVVTQDATYGTDIITWSVLATVWAEVQDVLPSRSESVKQGLAAARNQVRIRYRYRQDVDSSMRVRVGTRTLQIVGGPAELGQHEISEIVCESYSS